MDRVQLTDGRHPDVRRVRESRHAAVAREPSRFRGAGGFGRDPGGRGVREGSDGRGKAGDGVAADMTFPGHCKELPARTPS